jgi:pimeloyl-ACP methyl ester carboxylesterase
LLTLVPAIAQAQANPVLTPVACAGLKWEYADPAFQPLANAKAFFGRYDGGIYRIEIPDNWNGEFVLWARGARSDQGPKGHIVQPEMPGSTGGSARLRQHWIRNGYAWGASSYRCNGGPGIGLLDTLSLRDAFVKHSGKRPTRTYLTGASMGGGIVLRALHLLPNDFAAGIAMCPVVAPERFDFAMSVAMAAEAISGVQLHESTLDADIARMRQVLGTPENYTAKGRQLASVQINVSGGPRPFAVEGLKDRFMANIQDAVRSIPGNDVATNASTVYMLDERFGLTASALNKQVRRKPADVMLRGPKSRYLEVSALDGSIARPLMTLHGTGDLQVPISGERYLRQVVQKAGKSELLIQRVMRIPGHCRFSDEEQIQAFDDVVKWVNEGRRPEGDDVMADLTDAGKKFTNPLRPGDPGIVTLP